MNLPYPGLSQGVNSYLLRDEAAVLVDAGGPHPSSIDMLVSRIRDEGVEPGEVEWILNTHTHPDHAGADGAYGREHGSKIAVHGEEERFLWDLESVMEKWTEAYESVGGEGVRVSQYEKLYEGIEPVHAERTLSDGEKIELPHGGLEVVHTPGHSPGHVCFFDRESGHLFSGDHVVSGFSVFVGKPDGDVGRYLDSLERLKSLPVEKILPGHGPNVEDPQRHIEETIEHQRERLSQIEEILTEEWKGLQEISEAVYESHAGVTLVLRQLSTLARLEYMEEEGIVEADPPRRQFRLRG